MAVDAAPRPVRTAADASLRPPDGAASRPPDGAALRRRLWLTTQPAGASVLLDGRPIGTTPLRGVTIQGQAQVLQVRRRGYQPRRLRLGAGRDPVRRRIALRPQRPPARAKRVKLHLATTCDGEMMWAQVYLDGVPTGRTPITLEVAPGRHRLRVVRNGYRSIRKRVDLHAKEQHLSFELRRR